MYLVPLRKINKDKRNQGSFTIQDTNTIAYGKCYTLEFLKNISFSNLDNVVIAYKDRAVMFAHGTGQEIGLIANFFPVQPQIFQLANKQKSHVSFQALQTITEEYLGCNGSTTETEFYSCAKRAFASEMITNGMNCTLPMISNILEQGPDMPYCRDNVTSG